MPARDLYHQTVVHALVKDGWTITHDPLTLPFGNRDVFVDLGAERFVAAQRQNELIAVEIKSFGSPSEINDLEKAVGQFVLYSDILRELEPKRMLFLSIRRETFEGLFQEPIGQLLLKNHRLRLLVFDAQTEEVVQWMP